MRGRLNRHVAEVQSLVFALVSGVLEHVLQITTILGRSDIVAFEALVLNGGPDL